MTDEKRHILIVDDSADDIHVLMENLKQDYAVLAATSGDKALEMAAKNPQPDVILLDVSMPGMDGYETCRRLMANAETREIKVIFVSAHDTTEEKLAGYDAGGSDYLIKPVQPDVLQQKVKLAIKNRGAHASTEAEKNMAMQTAMTALSNVGEQGVILDFMRRSFLVTSAEELARLIVEATGNFGLESSVQIRGFPELVYAGSTEPMPPLEQELLRRLKDAGRFWNEGTHFAANFDTISLLIKNMPEDEDKLGRLRDHLAMMLEGAEARLRGLIMDEESAKTNTRLTETQDQLLQSEKMAAIGQLAAGVAHEINNPIGFVTSNVGTLQKYVEELFLMLDAYEQLETVVADTNPELLRIKTVKQEIDLAFLKGDILDLLGESRDGVNRVQKIVQDLKDFSHVDEAEWQWSDLHKGIDSTLNIVNNELKYKADVIKKYSDLPEVECITSQINQVVMNILVNAAHAIEERGTITIETGKNEKDQVWIKISDTGKGIAPENLRRIFEPFFTTKPIGQGTGLGMSLSYGIIEKHSGSIDVESEINKGTIFTISLPVRQATPMAVQ